MASSSNPTDAARIKEKVLTRWEGEGGALRSGPQTGAMLDEADLRMLSRLGAALLDQWSALPEACQTAIVERASTLHAVTDGARIKAEIERFVLQCKER